MPPPADRLTAVDLEHLDAALDDRRFGNVIESSTDGTDQVPARWARSASSSGR